MITVESITPTPKKAIAYKAPEQYILYGGAMGGGKSHWLANYAIDLSMRYPGNRGYLCRHELVSFKKTTQQTLDECLDPRLLEQHNKSDHFYKFKNGSILWYGGLGDDIRAIEKLKSLEIGWFGIDQAEETTEAFFFMLISRLRLKLSGIEYKGLLTANPANNWVKARFIDKVLEDHVFIPALPKDNPYLPPDYVPNLKKTLPEDLVNTWVSGSWTDIADPFNVYPYDQIQAAMARRFDDIIGEEEYGVDVAEFGTDETVVAKRVGHTFTLPGIWRKLDPMETAGRIIRLIGYDDERKKVPIKIDAIGPGNGVYHRLREQGYNAIAIRGSEKPPGGNKERYRNAKTEYYWQLEGILHKISLPDDAKLRAQMTSCQYKVLSSDGLIRIESKEELKKRGLPSPDRLEAIIYANARAGGGRGMYVIESADLWGEDEDDD